MRIGVSRVILDGAAGTAAAGLVLATVARRSTTPSVPPPEPEPTYDADFVSVSTDCVKVPPCARYEGDTYCPKEVGGEAREYGGQIVCSRGECVELPTGELSCTRDPAGSASLDAYGEPLCRDSAGERVGCTAPRHNNCARLAPGTDSC